MNERELEELLTRSLHEQARASVGDDRTPPPPRFASALHTHRDRLAPARWLAPLAAAAAVLLIVGVALFIWRTPSPSHLSAATSPALRATPSASDPLLKQVVGKPVRVKLLNLDGGTVGVGMPVIAYFSRAITDARALSAATRVSVNGRQTQAAWYFERSQAHPGFPVEGHLRPETYWPAESRIDVALPVQGVSAGRGMTFADSLTLHFTTTAALIATVSSKRHLLTLTRNDKTIMTAPVSLGASSTPTQRGVKVIMDRGESICMVGAGYDHCHVQYTQRLTYSGEFLHAAPWNVIHIGHSDTSNGCTNLTTGDAKRLYSLMSIGDVVDYPDATGSAMTIGEGYGDWNLSWTKWLTGGLVPTR